MTAEPVALRVTRWKCPFCTRARASKAATVEHIGRCWSNPEVRSCKTCRHYEVTGGFCDGDPMCNCPPAEEICHAGIRLTGDVEVGCPAWQPEEPTT